MPKCNNLPRSDLREHLQIVSEQEYERIQSVGREFIQYMNNLMDTGHKVVWQDKQSCLVVIQFLHDRQRLTYLGKEIAWRFSKSVDENEIEKWVKKKIKSRIKLQAAYAAKTRKLLDEIYVELQMWHNLQF